MIYGKIYDFIFPRQITAEKIGLSFEFSLGRIILHLTKLFKIWKKKPKNLRPKHTHWTNSLHFLTIASIIFKPSSTDVDAKREQSLVVAAEIKAQPIHLWAY